MASLRGVPDRIQGFDVDASDWRLVSTTGRPGGLEPDVDQEPIDAGVDEATIAAAALAVLAIAWLVGRGL